MTRLFLIITSVLVFFSLNCSPSVKKLDTGIITKVSSNSLDSTYQKLRNLIAANPNLTIIAELDHQKNATTVDLDLNPTRIIMFGNPKLGTPLMQQVQTTGLDLPQKILVFQEPTGVVKIAYNDPVYLKKRHGIVGQEKILNTVANALASLTDKAIK
tara:strand:- start:5669 stop:6139 length:471 start_codon:yes stop_codon:yes gene_type:complete